ncbi:MAG: hypothetical protein JNJ73_11475 [Hyphomonadaceae bacterium]|nr:hypothetical protein [Hyphomonadaceae bacterium]
MSKSPSSRAEPDEAAASSAPGPVEDAVFARRLSRHGQRLTDAVRDLYGEHADFNAFHTRLMHLLRRSHDARPAHLKATDQARERDPDWFLRSSMLGYSTYVDRFAGTIADVNGRIDYLKRLGVNYLHFLPLLKARAGDSDGGFAVADFSAVEPRLGSIDDLSALARQLHLNGITLCIDFVLNHVADEHPWAQAALQGDPHYREFFHILPTRADVDRYEAHLDEIFPHTAPGNFTHQPALGGWVWTTFNPFQWDLNYANLNVFLAMLEILLEHANRGIDAFRLDSVAFIWKQLGSSSRSLPQAHTIIRAFRAAIDIAAPGVLMKAEAIIPLPDAAAFFGTPNAPEAHLSYNASLMASAWVSLVEEDARIMAEILRRSRQPELARWIAYIRCHDDISWAPLLADLPGEQRIGHAAHWLQGEIAGSWADGRSFQSNDGELHGTNGTLASLCGLADPYAPAAGQRPAIARILLLHAAMFASGGLPMINMGDELGLLNVRENITAGRDGRWLHRPDMDWRLASTAKAGDAAHAILTGLAGLAACMRAAGAAQPPRLIESDNPAVLTLAYGADQVALNFSARRQSFAPAPGRWRERTTGRSVAGKTALSGYGVLWLAPDES